MSTETKRRAHPANSPSFYRLGLGWIRCRPVPNRRENPENDLLVIDVVPRRRAKWERLYRGRTVINSMFNGMKRSRILNPHQFLAMRKVSARGNVHADLSRSDAGES